jgi:hypothetical protein
MSGNIQNDGQEVIRRLETHLPLVVVEMGDRARGSGREVVNGSEPGGRERGGIHVGEVHSRVCVSQSQF